MNINTLKIGQSIVTSSPNFKQGDKVVITQEVDLFPHGKAAKGLTGTTAHIVPHNEVSEGREVMVKLDKPLAFLADRDNELPCMFNDIKKATSTASTNASKPVTAAMKNIKKVTDAQPEDKVTEALFTSILSLNVPIAYDINQAKGMVGLGSMGDLYFHLSSNEPSVHFSMDDQFNHSFKSDFSQAHAVIQAFLTLKKTVSGLI
jgi:hypothetical protein